MTKPKTEYETSAIKIDATAEIAKGISVKVEKVGDEEVTVAHLKLKGLQVCRETMDLLIGWQPGRADLALFDETGEPRAYFTIEPSGEYEFGGSIAGNAETGEKLILGKATLQNVRLDLCPLGAKLSGEITWPAAGDEVSDTEPLLGKLCMVRAWIRGLRQRDLFKDAA